MQKHVQFVSLLNESLWSENILDSRFLLIKILPLHAEPCMIELIKLESC